MLNKFLVNEWLCVEDKSLKIIKKYQKLWNVHIYHLIFFLYLYIQWDYYLGEDKASFELLGKYKMLYRDVIEFVS